MLIEKEPLNAEELVIYMALNDHLKLPPEQLESLTHSQAFSAARVINKQGQVLFSFNANGYLAIKFPHIFIGIEPDGYAHS